MTILLRQKPLPQVVRQIVQRDNGAWFDPEDLSTMFQDAAGTIPVTAMEQPVGKILDKSGNNYHATQPITASRPTLSARYNLLTKTEDFAGAEWIKYYCSVTSGVTENPFGLSAVPVIISGNPNTFNFISQGTQPMTVGVKYTSFRYVKAGSATFCTLGLHQHADVFFDLVSLTYAFFGVGFSSASIEDVGQGWRKITASWVLEFATYPQVYFAIASSLSSPFGVPVGSSLYTTRHSFGVALDEYQRVNTATDYDSVGFPKYIKAEGVDDHFVLPYLGLYNNASCSIITSHSSSSQSANGVIVSEASSTDADTKYLPYRQLASAGNVDSYIAADNAAVILDSTGAAYSGTKENIIESIIDSGTSIETYRSGVLLSNEPYTRSATLTLNNTTLFGSVSTTNTNFLNTKLYGLIITKSNLSARDRSLCETYLKSKVQVLQV